MKDNLETNLQFSKSNPDFYNLFIELIKDFDLKTLLNIFIMIIGSYNKVAPETQIIEKNLEHHAKAVFECIKSI